MNIFSGISFSIQLQKIRFCKYQLVVDDKVMTLTFPQLLQLRNKLNKLTTFESLERIVANENYVLLFVADKQHLLFLEVPRLLDLRDEIHCYFAV